MWGKHKHTTSYKLNKDFNTISMHRRFISSYPSTEGKCLIRSEYVKEWRQLDWMGSRLGYSLFPFVGRLLGSELSIRHCRGTWAINTGPGFRFFPDRPKHREEDRRSGRWQRYSQLLHRTIILVAEVRFRPL